MSGTGGPVVRTENLHVELGGTEVLRGLSFAVEAGDYVGIVGPNGSGKTTLLKTILGFIAPVAGRVELWGENPRAFRDWRRVGYVPQIGPTSTLKLPLTVGELVSLGLLAGRWMPYWSRGGAGGAIRAALEAMKVSDLAANRVNSLSGGQQQRALLAQALARGPELLLMDEPTAALDPSFREHFYRTVERLNTENGTTVIMVTHDPATIGLYARRLLYIDRRLVFYGTFEEFCKSAEMAGYFGEFQQHQICHQHGGGGRGGLNCSSSTSRGAPCWPVSASA